MTMCSSMDYVACAYPRPDHVCVCVTRLTLGAVPSQRASSHLEGGLVPETSGGSALQGDLGRETDIGGRVPGAREGALGPQTPSYCHARRSVDTLVAVTRRLHVQLLSLACLSDGGGIAAITAPAAAGLPPSFGAR